MRESISKGKFWSRVRSFLPVVLVPLAFLLVAIRSRPSPGAIYLGRDATYYYVVNAFEVARGRGAYYFAHPGGPLLLLAGILVRLKAAIFPESALPLPDEWLLHSTAYATMLGGSLILLNFGALTLAGIALRKRGAPLALVMLTQLAWVTISRFWQFSGFYQPESAAPLLGALFAVAVLSRRGRLLRPAVAGLALALKLVYAPYLLLTLVAAGWRRKAASLAGAALWALAGSAVLLPVASLLLAHATGLALREGPYAEGGLGLAPWPALYQYIQQAHLELLLLSALLVILLGSSALAFRGGSRASRRRLGVLLLATLGAVLVYVRKPTHDYYALPAYFLAAIIPVGVYFVSRRGWRRYLPYALFLPLFAGLTGRLRGHFELQNEGDGLFGKAAATMRAMVERFPRCDLLLAGPLPLEIDALHMGADWAGPRIGGDLNRLFPGVMFLSGDFRLLRNFYIGEESTVPDWWKSRKPHCVLSIVVASEAGRLARANDLFAEGRELSCGRDWCYRLYPPETTEGTAPRNDGI